MEELQDLICLVPSIWFYVKSHKKVRTFQVLPLYSAGSLLDTAAEDLRAILSTKLCSKLHTVFHAVFCYVQTVL